MARSKIDVDAELLAIAGMGVDDLRALWRKRRGGDSPPALTKELIARVLACAVQIETFEPVPVEGFRGSLQEAVQESIRRNSKDKLPMRLDDKLNAAWRLVLTSHNPVRPTMTLPQIEAVTSISQRQVGTMRRALKDLLAEGRTLEDLMDMRWREAFNASKGREMDHLGQGDLTRQKAEKMCTAICKAVGGKQIIQDTEAFAIALMLIEERLPSWLMQSAAWHELVEEGEEEADEE